MLRPSHELTVSACNWVNLSVLTEAESSGVFCRPDVGKTAEGTGLVETVKSMWSFVWTLAGRLGT